MSRNTALLIALVFLAVGVLVAVVLPAMGQGITDADGLEPGPDDPNPTVKNVTWVIEHPFHFLGIFGSITGGLLLVMLWVDGEESEVSSS